MRAMRDSNLELMRIVLMYLIVCHHYVVNSGVTALWTPATITPSGVFLILWGMWGKAAINAFVLVTGWFMCRSLLTWRRYARLLLQVYFWKLAVWAFLAAVGAPGVSLREFAKSLASPFRGINDGFTASFLVMYLCIPFLNRLLSALDRGSHLRLLALLLAVNTLSPTLLASPTAFTEVGWYCTLYLLAAYLRMHELAWSTDPRTVSRLFAASVTLAVASVCAFMALDYILGLESRHAYYLVSDSGKALALACGVTCFLWFRLLPFRPSRAVNAVASTTFGVLLVHAHSDAMRAWLWGGSSMCPATTCSLASLRWRRTPWRRRRWCSPSAAASTC